MIPLRNNGTSTFFLLVLGLIVGATFASMRPAHAAEIIANELSRDIHKIDLSSTVSRYVGETERNIDRIFGRAESNDAVLFLDEADSLFGKRSDVKDSSERYTNIEINYLFQKLAEH